MSPDLIWVHVVCNRLLRGGGGREYGPHLDLRMSYLETHCQDREGVLLWALGIHHQILPQMFHYPPRVYGYPVNKRNL